MPTCVRARARARRVQDKGGGANCITASVRMPPAGCMLDLDAYASLTPPLRLDYLLDANTGAMSEAFLHGGSAKWPGGVAEYAMPSCTTNSSAASFDLRARLLPKAGGTYCKVVVNTKSFSIKHASAMAATAASDEYHSIGTVHAPRLSRHQIAIVIESLTLGCRMSTPYLAPRLHASSAAARSTSLPYTSVNPAGAAVGSDAAGATTWQQALASGGTRPCWRSGPSAIRAVCGSNGTRSGGVYGEHCAFASLILNDRFASYAYALERSLRAAGSEAPLVLLATADVSEASLQMLIRLGGGSGGRLKVRRVTPAKYPSRYRPSWENNETRKSLRFTKLEVWRLTEYRKVVLIDTDTLVLKPIDALFTCPQGSAVADMGAPGNFNSGVFVLEPSEAVYGELRRLTPLLISYNQGDQGFLNKAFPEWRLRPWEFQLPEAFNYLLRQRGSSEWLTSSWQRGVNVVHFTDVIKPHNWYLHPSMKASSTAASNDDMVSEARKGGGSVVSSSTRALSFVEAQGEMFQRWTAHSDRYHCEVAGRAAKAEAQAAKAEITAAGRNRTDRHPSAPSATLRKPLAAAAAKANGAPPPCNRTELELRNRACARVSARYSVPAEAPHQFCVLVSYAPFRKRLRILQRIERGLQAVREVHTIFLIEHIPAGVAAPPDPFVPSGPKPVLEVRPAFDALGHRFGPLAIPTEAVLIMDDDIVLDPRDLSLMFGTWRQMPTRLVGTWQRAVTVDDGGGVDGGAAARPGQQPPLHYRDYASDEAGMRQNNLVLTKQMFIHRDYLFMYSCMLPYELWNLPNRLIVRACAPAFSIHSLLLVVLVVVLLLALLLLLLLLR